jgi:hypothetical protein
MSSVIFLRDKTAFLSYNAVNCWYWKVWLSLSPWSFTCLLIESRQLGFKKISLPVTEKFWFVLTSLVTNFGWLLIPHWEVLLFLAVLLHHCGKLPTRKLTSLLISCNHLLFFFFVAEMFICVPYFGKVTVPLRKPCIFTWTTECGLVRTSGLVREISQIRLCTNSFSREWIYSRASLNDGDTFWEMHR